MRFVRSEPLILSLFVLAQALDGTLTYVGVQRFGHHAELNGLLRFYMEAFGPAAALAGAKLLACGCGTLLYVSACHRTVAALAGAYFGVAVVPWMIALWL
jgi:uncharacterized membrane protein